MKETYKYNKLTGKVEKVEEDPIGVIHPKFFFKGLVTNPMAKKWKDIKHKSEQEQNKPEGIGGELIGALSEAVKNAPKQVADDVLTVEKIKSAVEQLKAKSVKPSPYNTYVFGTGWSGSASPLPYPAPSALDPTGLYPPSPAYPGKQTVTKILYRTACGCTREQDVKNMFDNQPVPPTIEIPIQAQLTNPWTHSFNADPPVYSISKRVFKLYNIEKDPSGFLIAVYRELVK